MSAPGQYLADCIKRLSKQNAVLTCTHLSPDNEASVKPAIPESYVALTLTAETDSETGDGLRPINSKWSL